MTIDAHGQPFNSQFNRARRAERDISEFLGLAKGLLADGVVSPDEARLIAHWVASHPDAAEQWPINALADRLGRIFADGIVDPEEQRELRELLGAIVGGEAGVLLGHDAATELPLDTPPPELQWNGAVYVFTGKCAFGTRADCERQVNRLGGSCESSVTKRTTYLVIGTFGSRDWVHTSFGRKIEKAVSYRSPSAPPFIVGEDHWATCVSRAG
jgi:NAD-dependent DNA ligase